MADLRQALEELGIPSRDIYELPTSGRTFPDGGHYRLEIAGVERLSSLKALVDEANKREVTIHRIIATVGGSALLPMGELRDFAILAHEQRIEVIVTLGPLPNLGRQAVTAEGLVSGMRIRGSDNLFYLLTEIERVVEAGFRGFLVVDEGVMWLLGQLRERGYIPSEVTFKVSVFAGHANAAGASLLESLGADSFNPLSDLTLPMLASIRKAVNIPLDVYVYIVNAMGGVNRFYEAAEIVRVCSPCYLKFEPGQSEEEIYGPWVSEEAHSHLVRQKVRYASIVQELMGRLGADLVASPAGSDDLAIPQP
jgi:hypothetical protein